MLLTQTKVNYTKSLWVPPQSHVLSNCNQQSDVQM